jgi:hypothetical protein
LSLGSQKYGVGIRDPEKTYSKRHQLPDPDPQHCTYNLSKLAQRIYPEVRNVATPIKSILVLINAGQDHVNQDTIGQMTKITDVKILTSGHFVTALLLKFYTVDKNLHIFLPQH